MYCTYMDRSTSFSSRPGLRMEKDQERFIKSWDIFFAYITHTYIQTRTCTYIHTYNTTPCLRLPILPISLPTLFKLSLPSPLPSPPSLSLCLSCTLLSPNYALKNPPLPFLTKTAGGSFMLGLKPFLIMRDIMNAKKKNPPKVRVLNQNPFTSKVQRRILPFQAFHLQPKLCLQRWDLQ